MFLDSFEINTSLSLSLSLIWKKEWTDRLMNLYLKVKGLVLIQTRQDKLYYILASKSQSTRRHIFISVNIQSICRRQIQCYSKYEICLSYRWKTMDIKEMMLVTGIFSFSIMFSKVFALRRSWHCAVKGKKLLYDMYFFFLFLYQL